jgi:hypothetical protein
MKIIGGNKNIFKRAGLACLALVSFIATAAAVFSYARAAVTSPKEVGAIDASDYETILTLDSANKPTGSTYSGQYIPISGYTFYYNMATSYSSSVHCSLRNNQEGYIANVTPLTGFDYLSVNCRATTGTAICNIWASNTYSTTPYSSYTKIASETMSTSDADVTPTISASYKFFAVHVAVSSNFSRNNRLLINTLTLAKSYPLTGIAISGADTIGLADEGKPYAYTVIATYSNGATKDITKAATLTTPLINTMKLGLQTLSVSYKGFTASKTVRVTNVNAVVSKTIPAATYTDATFHNEDSISTGALLNGKTLSFNPDSDATTGAWDITCTAATTGNEYNAFLSSGVWQLGSEEAPYRTFTLTSRDIWVNMTYFSFRAWGTASTWYPWTFTGTVVGQIGSWTMSQIDMPDADTRIYEDLTTNPQTGHISLTFTVGSSCDEPFFLYDFEITTAGGTASYFTPTEQAHATRDFIQQYKTCPGGVSDETVQRCAIEYNAMSLDSTIGGTDAKALFKALTETVNDYDYSDASQYSGGTYNGGTASISGVNIYDKLSTMVKWYNKNHATKIYLYDTETYNLTDNGGTNGYLPVFTDAAGHIVTPTSSESSLSLTLIIVAASGAFTLLAIAGIYLISKKKKHQQNA